MFVKLFEISRVKYGRRDITKTTSPVIAITLPSIFLIISKIMWKKYQFVKTTMKLVRYAKKLVFKAQKPANVIVSENAAKEGHPISFMRFLAYGIPIVLISLLISTAYIYIRFLR